MKTYIVFASWEDRFIKSAINDINSEIKFVHCFYFEEFYDRTEPKIKELEEFLSDKDIKLKKIELKFEEYISSWKRVRDAFSDIEKINAILNISTMPRNMIFCMLHFLTKNKIKYNAVYYPAGGHSKQPTTNPLKPHIVLQHGGIMYPDKKTILVIFIGHDRKRVQQLCNYFEPYQVHLVSVNQNFTSTPSDYLDKFDIPNLEEHTIQEPSHIYTFDKLNDILTQETLGKHNVLLCSLGSKIESIGIYKFHRLHPETALLYAPSKDYAVDYSSGVDLNNPKTVESSWLESIENQRAQSN